MTQDHEDMRWRAAAVETVCDLRRSALRAAPTESVPLDSIAGRVLATDVVADADLPARDHATMDGYALDATRDYPLTVSGAEVFPADDPPALDPGTAVPIATGAPLPAEANAVLKREDATVEGDRLTGAAIDPGTYTYARGSNVTAGETLFERGERLTAKDAILLGDLGHESVTVTRPFSVGVFATGTEIHEGRQDDLDSDMLASLVRSWGHRPTYEGTAPDDFETVRNDIASLASAHDVVVTTGGTSVGHEDHVVRALADLGEVHFHRVRIRPGKPIAVATVDETVVFAIPGKPLGAWVVSTLVMRPFFTGRTDLPTVSARFSCDLELGPDGFEYAVPVTLDGDAATPLGHVDSPLAVYEDTFDPSVLSATTRASRADGFVLTTDPLGAGETVRVVRAESVE
jgi:molybdopterin molybdotransferase